MIWQPIYEDCNGALVPAKWFIQAESKEKAEFIAEQTIKKFGDDAYILMPHKMAFKIVDFKKVEFKENVFIL